MPLRSLSSLLTRGRAPTANLTRHTLLVPACVAPRFPWCHPLLLHLARAATTTTIPSVSHPPQDAVVPQEPRRSHKIDFGNTKVAYASVSTGELVRAYLVFKACSFRPLVTHADKLLQISYRLLGQAITESIVRNTFFAHFCAGETSQTIRPRIEELRKGGVAGILDYAAEADITQMMTSPLTKPKTHAYKEGEIACRVYSYESERQCDAHVETFLDCIHAVKDVTPEGFAAIKITALGNPHLLERMSVCIEETDRLFKKMDREGKGWITRKEFLDGYDRFFRSTPAPPSETSPVPTGIWAVKPEEMATQLLNRLDPDNTDRIDVIDWRMAVNISDMPALTHQCRETGPLKNAALSEQEMELMRAMQLRLEMLAGRAATLGVRLMIDAEQSYFQPAIDFLILDVMQRHNRDAFVVYTTMQCYLRDATERLEMEIERARRGGFLFAAKLVRGAYMVSERKRAAEKGYESPIHDTIEATHATYDGCVSTFLERMAAGEKLEVLVATHNQASIEKTLSGMDRLGLRGETSGVYFGQLLGMADHLTLSLGSAGYKAYKYVPYGLVGQVLPYLIRRAQENSDVMGGVKHEQGLIRAELWRRMLSA